MLLSDERAANSRRQQQDEFLPWPLSRMQNNLAFGAGAASQPSGNRET